MLAGNTYSKSISEYAEPLQPVQPHRYTVQTYQISSENLRMYTHTHTDSTYLISTAIIV